MQKTSLPSRRHEIDGPATIYAVALLYANFAEQRATARCATVVVSGNNPLTAEEVITRARKEIESRVPDLDPDDYMGYEFSHILANE